VVILENETFALNGWRFFGATLWTDFNLLGDQPSAMFAAGAKPGGMNDYRKIRRQDTSRLQPKHTAMLHAESRLALNHGLRRMGSALAALERRRGDPPASARSDR
jgi:hypothetical protein